MSSLTTWQAESESASLRAARCFRPSSTSAVMKTGEK